MKIPADQNSVCYLSACLGFFPSIVREIFSASSCMLIILQINQLIYKIEMLQ